MSSYLQFNKEVGCVYSLYAPTLKDVVQKSKSPSIIAVTADYIQSGLHKDLEGLGFRRVKRFKSSHNVENQILTLWIKTDKKLEPLKEVTPVLKQSPYQIPNCTVAFNPNDYSDTVKKSMLTQRVIVQTYKPEDKDKELYKKIKGANVWFKLDEKFVVKLTDAEKKKA